jgi:DNA-binding Lrp family transcriptional regulator
MTKIDKDLIYILSENSRISLKELSQDLKKSSQRLKYSVSVLEKEKILRNPYCIFDYSYFGLILFKVYFKGAYITEQDKDKIIKELINNPYVISIYELEGEFDLTIEFSCPNPSKFNKELKKISNLIPSLNDYKIVLNLVTHIYPRYYLTSNLTIKSLSPERIIGGDREIETFNKNEMNIMKSLLLNPKIRLIDLASSTTLNIKTAKSIINTLKKRNIIKGFKYIIDENKLGISKCRLFLKLHNLSLERESQFMKFLLNTYEIVQANKTVGDWDMEIDLESFDKSKIRLIIADLKEQFKDLIERFNLMEFYDYYKRSYLPQALFKEQEVTQQT